MSDLWIFLNNNSGAVQAISTIVLVGITAFYAFQMRKTNELISMQIFPKIFIIPDKLHSFLLNPEHVKKIKENLYTKDKQYSISFLLDYKIMNHSASSGSVERPQLLIENPTSGKKKLLSPDINSVVVDISLKGEIKNTIYLKAGEVKNMQEEFYFNFPSDKPSDEDVDLINNVSSLQYTVLYKNVIGQQFSVKLTKEQVLLPKN